MLNFGAVDWKADVFVNDILIGSHKGGFTPFSFNITPYLTGKNNQKLVVRVWILVIRDINRAVNKLPVRKAFGTHQ